MDLKVNEGLLFDDLMQVDNMFDFLSPKIVDFMNRPYPVETITDDIEVTPRQAKDIRMQKFSIVLMEDVVRNI